MERRAFRIGTIKFQSSPLLSRDDADKEMPMSDWWNSIEVLSRVKFWLGYAAVFGAVIVILNQVVALRLDALRAEQAKPRLLTQQQRTEIVNRLSGSPGHFILVTAVVGDGEAYRFAQQIDEVLKESGWDSRHTPSESFQVPPKGLAIFVRSRDELPAYFPLLVSTLQQVGLSPQWATSEYEGPNTARIVIGHKP